MANAHIVLHIEKLQNELFEVHISQNWQNFNNDFPTAIISLF